MRTRIRLVLVCAILGAFVAPEAARAGYVERAPAPAGQARVTPEATPRRPIAPATAIVRAQRRGRAPRPTRASRRSALAPPAPAARRCRLYLSHRALLL
jgi:hypothetical protein